MTISKRNKMALMLSALTIALSLSSMATDQPAHTNALNAVSQHQNPASSVWTLTEYLWKYAKSLYVIKKMKPNIIAHTLIPGKNAAYQQKLDMYKKETHQPILQEFMKTYNDILSASHFSQKKIETIQEAENILQTALKTKGDKTNFSLLRGKDGSVYGISFSFDNSHKTKRGETRQHIPVTGIIKNSKMQQAQQNDGNQNIATLADDHSGKGIDPSEIPETQLLKVIQDHANEEHLAGADKPFAQEQAEENQADVNMAQESVSK